MSTSAKFFKEFIRGEHPLNGATTMDDIVNQWPVVIGGVPKSPIMTKEKVKLLLDKQDVKLVIHDPRHDDVWYEYIRISPKLLETYPVLNWICTDHYYEDDGITPIVMEVRIHGKSVKAVYDFYKLFDKRVPVVVPWMAVPVTSEYSSRQVVQKWLATYKYKFSYYVSCERVNLLEELTFHAALYSTVMYMATHSSNEIRNVDHIQYQSITSYTREASPTLLHVHYRDIAANVDGSMLVTVGHQVGMLDRSCSISQAGADVSMTIMEELYSPYTGVKLVANRGN